MNLFIDSIEINWNYGLGIQPVSVFVYLKDLEEGGTSYKIEEVFKAIISSGVKDVIFYGDFHQIDILNWLTVKLLSEGYFVSAVLDSKNRAISELRASRVIVYLTLDNLKDSELSGLTESDYIIINESKIARILATVVRLGGLDIRVGRIYFNTLLLPRETALASKKLFNIYPYDGDAVLEN